MLQEIHIQNYAVIESLRVEFHAGLNVLTGETGSGKSILVDALQLALGGRAAAEVIRTGAERTTVSAIFRADGRRRSAATPWAAWLERHGVGGEGEAEIMLRREIHAGGRSRLLVNDEPVTLAAVRDLAPLLVEIHGQGEQAALEARDTQLDLLDAFAGAEELLGEVRKLFARRSELEREWLELNQSEQERLRTVDMLHFQVSELEAARPEIGEDERLEGERTLLRNFERVQASTAAAYGALYEEEGSALARLALATRSLAEAARYDRALEAHGEPLEAARALVNDVAQAVGSYLGRLEAEPGRLDEVEDRLALLDRLKHKYGGTLEAVLAFAERARQDLARIEGADARRGDVQRDLESARAAYSRAATALSHERRTAAVRLSRELGRELAQLGMEKARFEVDFEASDSQPGAETSAGGAQGTDRITFMVSANPGEELRPLDRIASGGEVSRLMLALKTVISAGAAGQRGGASGTLVFDEVDTGIGGRVAEFVGERLKRLARENQVLCVTHLPQIACFADHHYAVEKVERGGRTFAEIEHLDTEKERATELARMLSGRRITDAVLEHATAMLKLGSSQ